MTLTTVIRVAEAVPRPAAPPRVALPEVRAERCVHSLCETATCRHCVQACPVGAWQLNDDGLFLDTTRCDGCGLCAAACGQEALKIPASALVMERAGQRTAFAACEQAVAEGGAGVLPCVHAIGVRGLARLVAQGVHAVFICTGDCEGCSRAEARRIDADLRTMNRILRSRHLPPLHCEHVEERIWLEWRGVSRAAEGVSTERRRFLFSGLREVARLAHVLPESEQPGLPLPASAVLEGQGIGLAEWRPQLDAGRCEGCDACARLCPTQSLRHDAGAGAYRVHPDACTGCGLCADVCDLKAIEPLPLGKAAPYEIPLAGSRCRRCGVDFHLPVSAATDTSLCPVCRSANHHRMLFQVLGPADARPGAAFAEPKPAPTGDGS